MTIQTPPITTFSGELLTPDSPAYEGARSLYNGAFDRRPRLIARCAGPADVAAALAHARREGLVVAVRGGGHSISGYSSCDDGLVIDTGPLKSVDIDLERRTGRFGAGLTWGELDAATQAHGLAITGGRVTHTGIAGLTLGSGSGWLERKLGLTCEHLLSAEVVMADGRVVRASAQENHDLFWGLKGGGGNFGVVTEFEFRLQPIGPIVYAGMVLHPRSAAKDLFRFYRDFMAGAPDEICGGISLITAPPDDALPPAARGEPAVALILLYAGDAEAGAEAFRPLVEWGQPWLRLAEPMPYTAVQRFVDPAHPWGVCEYAKSDYLPELPDAAIDTLVDTAADIGSPLTGVHFVYLHGALDRTDRTSMALEAPDAGWYYMLEAMSFDPRQAEHERAWARRLMQTMRPWSLDRTLPNFMAGDDSAGRLRGFYGEQKFAQLIELKDKYDPDNVFSLNQNIRPSTTALAPGPAGARPAGLAGRPDGTRP